MCACALGDDGCTPRGTEDGSQQADQNNMWAETILLESVRSWLYACIGNPATTMINPRAARIP